MSGDDLAGARPAPQRAWFPRLLIALVLLFIGASLVLNAPDRFEESEVPVDGQPHTVAVTAYTATVLLADETRDTPGCTVSEPGATGTLPLAPPSRSTTSTGGTAGDYRGFQAFTPSTGEVEITCAGSDGVVLVSPENPGTPYLVARYGGASLLLLLGLGLLAQVATWGLRARRLTA